MEISRFGDFAYGLFPVIRVYWGLILILLNNFYKSREYFEEPLKILKSGPWKRSLGHNFRDARTLRIRLSKDPSKSFRGLPITFSFDVLEENEIAERSKDLSD